MNNSNYEYPPASSGGYTYNTPYSSTPTDGGGRRPRFGYSGSSYPRPRSSATKPNPDYNSYYGDSLSKSYGTSYDSYSELDGTHSNSSYYSTNESMYSNTLPPETATEKGYNSNFAAPRANAYPPLAPPPFPSTTFPQFGQNQLTYAGAPTFATNAVPGIRFKGFQKDRKFPGKKKGQPNSTMANQGFVLKCHVCNLDFTSQIPYDMHLRGARHAKKVKASQVSPAITAQAGVGIGGEQSFYCAVCDVKANSPLQYQMHLEGTKHKNKLNPPDPNQAQPASTEPGAGKKKKKAAAAATTPAVNEKTNGAVTRPLPADFDEPQKAKMMKFSCDICNLTVNSNTQLQQHLVSKKHQYKVEGKPMPKKMKKQKTDGEGTDVVMTETDPNATAASATTGEVIMGVKTLSSSFVKGGTIL